MNGLDNQDFRNLHEAARTCSANLDDTMAHDSIERGESRGPNCPQPKLDPMDLFDVRSALTEEERMVQDSVARLVDEKVLPIIQKCFEEHRFPRELVPELAALGLLGSSIEGYGCAGLNGISYGLICQQLERGDSGIRSFVSVQSSLCMYPIYAFGSEEQKQRYLPRMARGELIGCFGLTEPHGGSDPANMKTHAKRSARTGCSMARRCGSPMGPSPTSRSCGR